MPSVKFTGARTGRSEVSVRPHGVVRRGDVVDVDDERAAALTQLLPTIRVGADGRQVQAADFEYVGPEADPDAATREELRERARSLGLAHHGTKDEIAARIAEHEGSGVFPAEDETPPDGGPED